MTEKVVTSLDQVKEGQAKGFEVDLGGRRPIRLIVVRREGSFFVFENRCPHRGTPLDWSPDNFLDSESHHLISATHGALFRVEDGECISGPCIGESLRSLESRTDHGELYVMLPEGAAQAS